MISEKKQMLLAVADMSDEQKKSIADKLDEWTVSRIEASQTKRFAVDDIVVKDIEYTHTNAIHVDDVFLYYYLLGMKLTYQLWTDLYPDINEKTGIYAEISVHGYKYDNTPIRIFAIVTKTEFDEFYRGIVTEMKIEEE